MSEPLTATESAPTDEPLLEMRDIHKRFGATHALRGVAIEVRGGEVMALIGENGAGKSTLMKVLSGAVPPDSGRMRLAGAEFRPAGPHAARISGVAMIYQELNLAPDMSVEDNIMLGQEKSALGLLQRSEQRALVRRALDELGHPDLKPQAIVAKLPIGAQQLVEIARALVFDAQLIVFDEPTSSLTQHDTERLFAIIRRLRQQGRAVVYISHFLEEIQEVCDRYTVLRDGETVGVGPVAGASEAEIVALMVGRSVEDLFPQVPHVVQDEVLHVRDLSGRPSPEQVSLSVHRGEILGISGLVGSGRTELLRCLFGLDAVRSGEVRVAAVPIAARPAAAIKAGLGMVSEDRKAEGLAQGLSIEDNLTLSQMRPYSRWGWLNRPARLRQARHWMQQLQVKARSAEQPVADLSGGNQQKVALARIMHQDADVLLLDEPTRGIDVGTKSEIYRLMGELAAAGKAVIFVSSYLPELLAMCDRIAVMARGRLRAVQDTSQWTEESLMAHAISRDD